MPTLFEMIARMEEHHVKQYPSTSDEVWQREHTAFCGGCRHAWPCDVAVLIDALAREMRG